MNKKILIGLCFSLLGTNLFAAQTMTTDRVKRILSDSVLKATVSGVETKYRLACKAKEQDIAWRCLNGPQCGYTLELLCNTSRADVSVEGMQMIVQGFDNGTENEVNSIQFTHVR